MWDNTLTGFQNNREMFYFYETNKPEFVMRRSVTGVVLLLLLNSACFDDKTENGVPEDSSHFRRLSSVKS